MCGQEKCNDVMSAVAQQRHGFAVGKLPDFSTLSDNPLVEALTDNTRTGVPDQVAFRVDFPSWRRTHPDRTRRIIDGMMVGERTQDLSDKFGTSPARISQLRRELHDDWTLFCG